MITYTNYVLTMILIVLTIGVFVGLKLKTIQLKKEGKL